MTPSTYVLFGATGDLARRKILPSLCKLYTEKGEPTHIIACGREAYTTETFRSFVHSLLTSFSEREKESFLENIQYLKGTLEDASFYQALQKEVATTKVLFHFSLPPSLYETVIEHLGKAAFTGIILLEKPFGIDKISAEHLQKSIETYFPAGSIFRVDHYFGKAGLQELLAYKEQHPEFQNRLNATELRSITYKIHEALDVQGRGSFYDAVGALRDVGQNHLLLMLATALMDTTSEHPTPLRRAQVLETLKTENLSVARGQYKGYIDEQGVADASETETYFKIVTTSSAPHLEGVELILEAGKKLLQKKTEVIFSFKDGTEKVFDIEQSGTHYDYAPLIHAALHEDASFFTSIEEVLASWRFIDAVYQEFTHTPLAYY